MVRGAAGSFVLKIANAALALAMTVLLSRLLGADGYGVYAFAMAAVTLLGVPTQFGLPTLVVRCTAAYRAREEWHLLRGLLQRANQFTLLVSLSCAAIAGAAVWYSRAFDPRTSATLAWALALLPLLSLGAVRSAALRGLHHVVLGQAPEMLVRPLIFCASLALAYWTLGRTLAPDDAMALHAGAAGVAFACGAWWLWRRIPVEVKRARPGSELRSWSRSVLPLMLSSGLLVLHTEVDVLLLGLFRPPEEAGVFRIAARTMELALIGRYAIQTATAPTFAELYAAGDMPGLQRVVTQSARITFLLTAPAVLVFVFYGEPLLVAAFGQDFDAAYHPLVILSVGQMISIWAGPVGFLLNMTGHDRDVASAYTMTILLHVLVSLALIPPLGPVGAALATSLTNALCNPLLLVPAVSRRLGIRPTVLALRAGPFRRRSGQDQP